MKHYISIAVAMLLGYTNAINMASVVTHKAEELNESNRYIGKDDKPINLS